MKNQNLGSFLLFLFALSFCIPAFPIFIREFGNGDSSSFQEDIFIPPIFDKNDIFKWEQSIRHIDKNRNGLNDNFEQKLDNLSELISQRNENQIFCSSSGEQIPLIMHTDENNAFGAFPNDSYSNNLFPAIGTSMATPVVAGAANLLIEAMGGYQKTKMMR